MRPACARVEGAGAEGSARSLRAGCTGTVLRPVRALWRTQPARVRHRTLKRAAHGIDLCRDSAFATEQSVGSMSSELQSRSCLLPALSEMNPVGSGVAGHRTQDLATDLEGSYR